MLPSRLRDKLLLVSFLFSGAAFAAAWVYCTSADSQVVLQRSLDPDQTIAADASHDFGFVPRGVILRHRFKLTNNTGTTWTPKGVHTSCACATSNLGTAAIHPGETLEFEVAYRTPTSERKDRQTIRVLFHEPRAPFLTFQLLAEVLDDFSISEHSIAINELSLKGNARRWIELSNNTDTIWQGMSVSANVPWVEVNLQLTSYSQKLLMAD